MNDLFPFRLTMFILFAACVYACSGSKPAKTTAAAEEGLRFDTRHFERELPGCKKEGGRCARITLNYPVAVGGAERTRQFINDTIEQHIWKTIAGYAFSANLDTFDPDTITRRFFEEYLDYVKEIEDSDLDWEAETTGELRYQSARILTISLHSYSFLGGAHPSAYTELFNFDLRRLKILKLEDVVADTERLQRLAEAYFREYHELDKDANLNEAGFFWDKPFFLPEYFAIEEEGLLLFYNQYEAAAYAVGTTELLIPWKELKGILSKGFEK